MRESRGPLLVLLTIVLFSLSCLCQGEPVYHENIHLPPQLPESNPDVSDMLDLWDMIKSHLEIEKHIVEAYLISYYLSALAHWVASQVGGKLESGDMFHAFNIYQISIPDSDKRREISNKQFPTTNNDNASEGSHGYRNLEDRSKSWLKSLKKTVTSDDVNQIISYLWPAALQSVHKYFPTSHSELGNANHVSPFYTGLMETFRIWRSKIKEIGLSGGFSNPISYLVSIIAPSLDSGADTMMLKLIDWASKHPLGPKDTPMASPLLALGALIAQIMVRTLLMHIHRNDLVPMIENLGKWLDTPIKVNSQVSKALLIENQFKEKVKKALSVSGKAKMLSLPEDSEITWGLVIGLLAASVNRMKRSESSELTDKQIEQLVKHVHELTMLKSSQAAEPFWGFFKKLPDASLVALVTHWLGSVQLVCRLGIYTISRFQDLTISILSKHELSIPFDILEVVAGFPICRSQCSGQSSNTSSADLSAEDAAKATAAVAMVKWLLNLIGIILQTSSEISLNDAHTHKISPRRRSGKLWSMLVEIPGLFCQYYIWSLSNPPKENARIDEEHLKKLVGGLPVESIGLYIPDRSRYVKRLLMSMFSPEDPEIIHQLLSFNDITPDSVSEDSIEKWIHRKMTTLLDAIDKGKCDNMLGECPKERPQEPRTSSPMSSNSASESSRPQSTHDDPIQQEVLVPGPLSRSVYDIENAQKKTQEQTGARQNEQEPSCKNPCACLKATG